MSRSRLLMLCLPLALLASACGGAGKAADAGPSGPPAVLDTCATVTGTWRALSGSPVDAATTGSGPVVVLANTSGNDPCDWLDLAAVLARKGFRAVVFAYADPSADAEDRAVADTIDVARAAAGDHDYALVGASLGGRVVIQAAGRRTPHLAAIVSLSGEVSVEDYGDITAAARRVTTPTLYVGARRDPLTKGTVQQDALHRAMHGDPNLLLQVPGAEHGTALLSGASGPRVTDRVVGFLEDQLR